MTRKDHRKIAALLASEQSESSLLAAQWESEQYRTRAIMKRFAEAFAEIAKADNKRFDKEKFLRACGF